MKKLFIIFLILNASTSFAQVRVFDLNSIDTISTSTKEVKVEDLRDGYEAINGVFVDDNSVYVNEKSETTLKFRNSLLGSSKINVRAAIKIGGGDGGGG
jgi:hypothetical protein